jgi:hypothetical protein
VENPPLDGGFSTSFFLDLSLSLAGLMLKYIEVISKVEKIANLGVKSGIPS